MAAIVRGGAPVSIGPSFGTSTFRSTGRRRRGSTFLEELGAGLSGIAETKERERERKAQEERDKLNREKFEAEAAERERKALIERRDALLKERAALEKEAATRQFGSALAGLAQARAQEEQGLTFEGLPIEQAQGPRAIDFFRQLVPQRGAELAGVGGSPETIKTLASLAPKTASERSRQVLKDLGGAQAVAGTIGLEAFAPPQLRETIKGVKKVPKPLEFTDTFNEVIAELFGATTTNPSKEQIAVAKDLLRQRRIVDAARKDANRELSRFQTEMQLRMDRPLSAKESEGIVFLRPDGSIGRPTPGMNRRSLSGQTLGFIRPKEQEVLDKTDLANRQIEILEGLGGSIINNKFVKEAIPEGLVREVGAITNIDQASQRYNSMKKAFLGTFSRAMFGETGVLTDRDVARVENAFPKLTDTAETKRVKLAILRDLNNFSRETVKLRIFNGLDKARRRSEALDLINSLEGKGQKREILRRGRLDIDPSTGIPKFTPVQ